MSNQSQAAGIYITNKIAAILNRKMKAAGYPTTIKKLKGYYGMIVIEVFGGAVTEDCNEIANLIVESYDQANPQEAYERRMQDEMYR